MTRKIIKSNLLITLIGLLLFVGTISAEIPKDVKKYAIPDHGFLELTFPASWKVEVARSQEKPYLNIMCKPESGDEFQVFATVLWNKEENLNFNDQEQLKILVEKESKLYLTKIVESNIVLQEIKGVNTTGYYFSITDKAPRPGEYLYMTQVTIGVGNLLLNVSILSRSKESESVKEALSILREARQIEK